MSAALRLTALIAMLASAGLVVWIVLQIGSVR